MIFDQSRSWPHPVLSPLTDDVEASHFDFDLDVWPNYPDWRLKVAAKEGDAAIARYLASDRASYFLHIECRRTHFRQAFSSKSPNFELTIPGDQLFGTVEASFLIVATKDIEAYAHPRQHSDYRNATFDIAAGEPLAVALTQRFEAPLEADPILKLSSILDIRKGKEDLIFMRVNCEGERIILELPPTEYDRYRNLRADPSLRGLLASTVILPGLLQSFYYLRDPALDVNEFRADHRWSRRVLGRLEEMGINLFGDGGNGAVCLEAAQQLLRGPLRRSLEDLTIRFS
jgi:hypothetical protein